MILARSLLFGLLFYGTTVLFTVVGSPLLLAPRRYAMFGLKVHATASLWLLRAIVGTKIDVRGRDRLPAGAILIAAKHQSAWDTFALIPLLRDPAMVMKAELAHIPFYGWFCRKFEMIVLRRERAAAAMRSLIEDAKARAAEGRQIIIFPEGNRRVPGAPPDYKPGVIAIYEGLGLPCVPVAVNSGLFWPRRKFLRYPGTIVVEILAPIPPGLPRREFRARLESAIETATARLVAEAVAQGVTAPADAPVA